MLACLSATPDPMRPGVGAASRRSFGPPRPQAATIIPWSQLPSSQIVGLVPRRPSLELAGSPAGWAGRVVQGDGVVSVLAVRVGLLAEERGGAGCAPRPAQVISVGPGALAVSARRDGLWVMYRERLVSVDELGVARQAVRLPGASLVGASLVGAAADSAWLVRGAEAWHVDAEGAALGPYPWLAAPGASAFSAGERLCGRAGAAHALMCLDRRGMSEMRTLGVSLSPGEAPLALAGDAAAAEVITAQGTTLRRWRGGDLVEEQVLAAAGVDAVKRSFAMSAAGQELVLGRQGGDAAPAPVQRFPAMTGLASASIEGGQVTLYRQGVMVRYSGAAPDATVEESKADEAAYRHAIFPAAWTLSRRGAVAAAGCASGEPVIGVAASGPEGVVIVPLSLSDR